MDLTTISTAAVALVLRPDAPGDRGPHDADAPRQLRRVIIAALPEVAGWLDGSAPPDAEHLHCLVDLVRVTAEKNPPFRGEVVSAVRAAGGGPAASLRDLGDHCGRERYWDTAAWCYRNAEALFRARGDALGAARCRADLDGLHELRGRLVGLDADDHPSGPLADDRAAAVLG